MKTPSQHIFTTKITQPDDTKTCAISSQPLSDASIHINARGNSSAVSLLIGLYLQNNGVVDNNPLARLINKIIRYRWMVPDVWRKILEFSFGGQLESLGNYAVAIRRPTLFPQITMHPFVIVDAAIRGQEDMVTNILKADPSFLLKKAKVKNSVDVEYEVTPLQAAMMANDIQMVEKMQKHFAHLTTDLNGSPINGLAEMHQQIKAIYMQSLNRYRDIQLAVLKEQEAKKLQLTQTKQYEEIEEKIKHYKAALEQDDIHKIIEIHNQAQEHNAFDFQLYVDAILNASPAELDDVMELINARTPEETAAVIARTGVAEKQTDATRAKSFDELTLVEKLNRFREKFVAHMQQEIIFNPNHILTGLKHNEETWNAVDAGRIADPGYQKRSIIFSQLAGWAQRNVDEPVRQDMRQGTYYLIEKNEARARQSRFNEYRHGDIVRNSMVDVSLVNSSVVDGVGYKFGLCGWSAWRVGGWPRVRCAFCFSKLMSSKNSKLGKLMQSARASARKSEQRQCVVS